MSASLINIDTKPMASARKIKEVSGDTTIEKPLTIFLYLCGHFKKLKRYNESKRNSDVDQTKVGRPSKVC